MTNTKALAAAAMLLAVPKSVDACMGCVSQGCWDMSGCAAGETLNTDGICMTGTCVAVDCCSPAPPGAGGSGDPHYRCPSGEKFDFEGVEGEKYSLIHDHESLDVVVTYTTGDAASNTISKSQVAAARKLSATYKPTAAEQNSVFTYMDSVKLSVKDSAEIVLATNAGFDGLENAFTLLDMATGEHCQVGKTCDLDAFSGISLSLEDVGPCKFHRPGRKLLPKGEQRQIADRSTESSCQKLAVSSDDFDMSFTFVPAGEMNGSAGVNYLDFSIERLDNISDGIDGIVGQCFNRSFSERHAAFPDFMKTKFCDTCEEAFVL